MWPLSTVHHIYVKELTHWNCTKVSDLLCTFLHCSYLPAVQWEGMDGLGPYLQCRRRGGQQGQFAPGPRCKGGPKKCRTHSNKMHSSVTFQSTFFKGLVSLYFRLKSACSFALCFMLLTQIMHDYLTLLLRSSLARALYVVLFDLKPLIGDVNLKVYMYCACTKKSLRSPQNTLQSM